MSIDKFKKDWIGNLVGVLIAILVISYSYSIRPVLEMIDTPSEPIIVFRGNSFSYCRTVDYTRDVFVKLDKSLVKHSVTGEFLTLSYPSHTFHREEGERTICKAMTFPSHLPNGEWVIETYIEHKTFPFWTTSMKLDDVYLNVKDK